MSPKRVLLVEDDPDVAMLSTMALTERGMHVEVASTVEKALAMCEATPWDVAVVDIGMPLSSGLAFAREVRRDGRWPGMRLAIYSVHSGDAEARRQADAIGVDGFFGKTGDPADLVAAVEDILR